MKPDEILVASAARNAGRGLPAMPRWVAVTRVFAVGSTMAHAICQRFGLDPDEIVGRSQDKGDD